MPTQTEHLESYNCPLSIELVVVADKVMLNIGEPVYPTSGLVGYRM